MPLRAPLAAGLACFCAALCSAPAAVAAPPADDATGRLLVLLRTPEIPVVGEGGATAVDRRDALARSIDVLDRVAAANDLDVEAEVPHVGLLTIDPGGASLAQVRAQLA